MNDLDQLEKAIKTVLPKDTVILFHASDKNLKTLINSLASLQKSVFSRYGITAIACPDSIAITIIPSGVSPHDIDIDGHEGVLDS